MKAFEEKHLDVEHVGDIEGHDMEIDAKGMAFVYDLMFSQMYRQPVESVVREITSNCFDAHAEVGCTDAVVVGFDEDEAGKYIFFKDVGVGLSPDRMEKVYRKPTTSTKRDTNGQIGYWGLGSKSPLAYDDSFSLETNFDGVHYEYIVHKGTKGIPRIEKVLENKTTERNGSTVRVYLKENNDHLKFRLAIRSQLTYFDNVFVQGDLSYNNDYKLYIGKTFKFRSDTPDNESLHLCIGKVKYPIDWRIIGKEPIQLPFGLKFEIGDLPITPERESIKYVQVERGGKQVEVVDIIKEKITSFLQELQELIGTEVVEHNNIIDWYHSKDRHLTIELLGRSIPLRNYVKKQEHEYAPFAPIRNFTSVPLDFFRCIKVTRQIYVRNLKRNLPEPRSVDRYSNFLTISDLESHLIIREERFADKVRPIMADYLKHLCTQKGVHSIMWVKEDRSGEQGINKKDKLWYNMLFNKAHRKGNDRFSSFSVSTNYTNLNKVKAWKLYKAVMHRELFMNSIEMATLEIPEDFTKKWKDEHKRAAPRVKTVEDVEVAVFNLRNGSPRNGLSKSVLKLTDLKKFSGFILYGFGKDVDLLLRYSTLFTAGRYSNSKASALYQINMKDEKYFMRNKHCIYVRDFMSDHKVFRKIASGAVIRRSQIWENARFMSLGMNLAVPILETSFDLIFTPVTEKLKGLKRISEDTANYKETNVTDKEFLTSVITIATENGWIEPEVKEDLEKCERYFKGTNLMKYILFCPQSMPFIAEYLHLIGKPVNKEWSNPEPWVTELLKDLLEKENYMFSCYTYLNNCNRSGLRTDRYNAYRKRYYTASTTTQEEIKLLKLLNDYHEERIKKN